METPNKHQMKGTHSQDANATDESVHWSLGENWIISLKAVRLPGTCPLIAGWASAWINKKIRCPSTLTACLMTTLTSNDAFSGHYCQIYRGNVITSLLKHICEILNFQNSLESLLEILSPGVSSDFWGYIRLMVSEKKLFDAVCVTA